MGNMASAHEYAFSRTCVDTYAHCCGSEPENPNLAFKLGDVVQAGVSVTRPVVRASVHAGKLELQRRTAA